MVPKTYLRLDIQVASYRTCTLTAPRCFLVHGHVDNRKHMSVKRLQDNAYQSATVFSVWCAVARVGIRRFIDAVPAGDSGEPVELRDASARRQLRGHVLPSQVSVVNYECIILTLVPE